MSFEKNSVAKQQRRNGKAIIAREFITSAEYQREMIVERNISPFWTNNLHCFAQRPMFVFRFGKQISSE